MAKPTTEELDVAQFGRVVHQRPDRAQVAYDVFRGGFRKGHPNTPPPWDDLKPWIRDAMLVAYLQGKLDGSTRYAGGHMLDDEQEARK